MLRWVEEAVVVGDLTLQYESDFFSIGDGYMQCQSIDRMERERKSYRHVFSIVVNSCAMY